MGEGGRLICQSLLSAFSVGQGFASTICNVLREFQHRHRIKSDEDDDDDDDEEED